MLRNLVLAALLALPFPAHACTLPPAPEIAAHLAALNAERARAGRAPLELAPGLARAAQGHACDMARRGYFSHTAPGGQGMAARVQAAGVTGYCALGENIARGQRDVASVMASWMRSPGHRRNILAPGFTHVGFGHGDGAHWVQVFAGRC